MLRLERNKLDDELNEEHEKRVELEMKYDELVRQEEQAVNELKELKRLENEFKFKSESDE